MTHAIKRACDACHRRKVRCDGSTPCRNCSAAHLACTYNAIPQKKGPKGSRAKVISELRETQRQTSLAVRVQNRMSGIPCAAVNTNLNPTPGLLSMDFAKTCLSFFFDNLYAQHPILDRNVLETQMAQMEQNRDSYCLMTSLCAFIMLQPGMTMPPGDTQNLDMVPGATIVASHLLLEECLRVRKGTDYHDSVNLNVLATNFFIYGYYYGMEMHDKAWYYLREATTMAYMVGMNKEEHYSHFERAESVRRRRLYWLLFVTERAYAIQRHHPLTLQATIHPSSVNDDPSDPLYPDMNNFFLLCNLFRPIDDTFLATWRHGCRHLDAQQVTGLSKHLLERVNSFVQEPNFVVVQQWLKNTVWQLNNGNSEDAMSFQYPVNTSRDLLAALANQFPSQGIDLIGSGLIPKLFETCVHLTEVLPTLPQQRSPYALGPRQWLSHLLSIVEAIQNGDCRFVLVLLSKVTEILPRIVNPMLQNAPENTQFKLADDIFDGFGNAGMAQMPIDDYNQSLPMDDYEPANAMVLRPSMETDFMSVVHSPWSQSHETWPSHSEPRGFS
ncbi:hypothetical protein F66182_9194 [Fusarium sp. NRRL 66182]|nr:hypothetical protein F66182_9194 [Fusarium sp. NRRL 66182]